MLMFDYDGTKFYIYSVLLGVHAVCLAGFDNLKPLHEAAYKYSSNNDLF